MPPPSTFRPALLALAGFLALSAGFLWQPLVTGKVFLPADLVFQYDAFWVAEGRERGRTVAQNALLADVSDYYYPYRAHALAELREGRFPLWNPYILTGTPFFASAQAALLDPVNLVTLPTGRFASWTWGAWLRIALIGWFTWGLARALGRSGVAAFAAGAIFMLSGIVTVWLHFPIVTSLVWMPALFWASQRVIETGSRRSVAATALAVGALLLGGHPETQFLVGLTWGLFCLHSLASSRPPWRGRLASLAAAAGLGIAVGVAQTLPFVDFLFDSHAFVARDSAPTSFDAVESAARIAVFLLPNLGGTRTGRDYWLPESDYLNFNERTSYLGLLALGLALLGFRAARRAGGADARRGWFFGVAALVALLLAVRAPGFHLANELPLLDVGHGVRWSIVSSFFGALLAARGVDALRAAGPLELRHVGIAFGSLAGLGLAALLGGWAILAHAVPSDDVLMLHSYGEVTLVQRGVLAELLDPRHLTVHPPLLFLLAGSAVLLGMGWERLAPHAGAVTICALAYLELLAFGSRYNPVIAEEEIFPSTRPLRYLEQHLAHERFAGGAEMLRPNIGMVFGLRDLRGYEDLVDFDFDRLYGRTLRRLGALEWNRSPSLGRDDLRLLELASVRFLLSAQPIRSDFLSPYRLASTSPGVLIYESREALPRARVVFGARVVPDAESAREALLAADFDPSREVILVGGGEPRRAGDRVAPPITWRVDRAETLVLEATLPAPGYLVVSDRHSPDWQASVDGEPASVLQANGAFRAVALPQGTHEVRFHYRPRLVYASLAVSGTACVSILFQLLRPAGRGRTA
jgi:hypothetical protein